MRSLKSLFNENKRKKLNSAKKEKKKNYARGHTQLFPVTNPTEFHTMRLSLVRRFLDIISKRKI